MTRGGAWLHAHALVDGDPRRQPRGDLEPDAERLDLGVDLIERRARLEIRHALATEQRGDRGIALAEVRRGHADALLPRIVRELTAHHELATLRAQLQSGEQRRAGEYVGHVLRHVPHERGARDLHVRQHGHPRAIEQPLRAALGILIETYDHFCAATRARELRGERAIDRRSDAEHVQATTRRQLFVQHAQDLLLAADVAIGDHEDLALRADPQGVQCFDHRLAHLGPAIGVPRAHPCDRFGLRFRRGGDGLGFVATRLVRKLDHLEPIRLAERIDHHADDLLRLVERAHAHRAARVEQHQQIARDRGDVGGLRRWNDRDQAVHLAGLARARHRERHANRGLRHRPAHDEIAVETRAGRERDRSIRLRCEPVRWRARRAAIGDRVLDRELDLQANTDVLGGHLDVRRARVVDGLGATAVARADHRGEPQLPLALGQPHQALVDRDPRRDALAAGDVAELLREDIGALLLE